MRFLHWLLLVETMALLLLVVVWLTRSEGSAAHSSFDVGNETENTSPVPDRESLSLVRREELSVGNSDREAQSTERERLLVYGTVRDEQGRPIPHAGIAFTQVDQRRTSTTGPSGAYAVPALYAGRWEIGCGAVGFADLHLTRTLEAEQRQRIDLVLKPWFEVRVKIQSIGGEPLGMPNAQPSVSAMLSVVATREPLAADLEPFADRRIINVGVGRYESVGDIGVDRSGELRKLGYAGVLKLEEEPPLFTALYFRHLWLQSQPIGPGQNEVTFHLPADAFSSRLGGLKLRLVDAETGAPAKSGFVSVSTSQNRVPPVAIDASGRVAFENVLPGLVELHIEGTGGEEPVLRVRVPAGETFDLGDIKISPAILLEGLVVDDAGQPMTNAIIQIAALDRRGPWDEPRMSMCAATDVDGRFKVQRLGRHRFALQAEIDELIGYAECDARNGAPPMVRIEIAQRVAVPIRSHDDPAQSYVVTAIDARGVRADVAPIGGMSRRRFLSLRCGTYTMQIHGGDGLLVRSFSMDVGPGSQAIEVRTSST